MPITPATAQADPQQLTPDDDEATIFEAATPDDGVKSIRVWAPGSHEVLVNVSGLHSEGEWARVRGDEGELFSAGFRDVMHVKAKCPSGVSRTLFGWHVVRR